MAPAPGGRDASGLTVAISHEEVRPADTRSPCRARRWAFSSEACLAQCLNSSPAPKAGGASSRPPVASPHLKLSAHPPRGFGDRWRGSLPPDDEAGRPTDHIDARVKHFDGVSGMMRRLNWRRNLWFAEFQIAVEHDIAFVAAELFEAGRMDAARHVGAQRAALDTPRFSYPCQLLRAKSSRSCGMDRNSCWIRTYWTLACLSPFTGWQCG